MKGRKPKYPWNTMEVHETFEIDSLNINAIRAMTSRASKRYAPKKFRVVDYDTQPYLIVRTA